MSTEDSNKELGGVELFNEFVMEKENFLEPEQVEESVEEVEDTTTEETEEEEVVEETEETEEETTEDVETTDTEEETEETTVEDTEIEEGEEVSFKPVIEMIHEANGWEFDDDKFKDANDVDSLMEFIGEIVAQNSQPQYASRESARFDEFIKKHGVDKAADFLELNFGQVDYENIDLGDEINQKRVYKDYLKATTKFSDAKIDKEIKKLVDLDELESEVGEAKDFLIEDTKKRAEEYEKHLEIEKENRVREWQQHLENERKRILAMDEIAEFKLDKKERENFYDYLYTTDRTGKTGYQQEIENNPDLNLKLAYLAFKGTDKSKISKSVKTETVNKLKKTLSRHKDVNADKSKSTSAPKKSNPNKETDYNEFVL